MERLRGMNGWFDLQTKAIWGLLVAIALGGVGDIQRDCVEFWEREHHSHHDVLPPVKPPHSEICVSSVRKAPAISWCLETETFCFYAWGKRCGVAFPRESPGERLPVSCALPTLSTESRVKELPNVFQQMLVTSILSYTSTGNDKNAYFRLK